MYGFRPSPSHGERRQAAAGEGRSSRPEQRVAVEEAGQRRLVDARNGHVRQHPEDDEDPQDEENPTADVGRAERLQQRIEHGSVGLVGRRAGARLVVGGRVGRFRRRFRGVSRRRLGSLRGCRPCGFGRPERRPLQPQARLAPTPSALTSCPCRSRSRLWPWRLPGPRAPASSPPRVRRPSSARRSMRPSGSSGSRGPARTRRPPRSSRPRLLAERVGHHEQRHRDVAVAQHLERLVQRPHEADCPEDVLVDRDRSRARRLRARAAGLLGQLELAELRHGRLIRPRFTTS